MTFRKLVAVFDRLEGLSSRNEMRRVLAGFFDDTPKSDLDSVAYVLLGRIDAEYKRSDKGPEQAPTAREITTIARGGIRERNRRRSLRRATG